MKIIVPMAGRGSRLRPHTLTTPKPLLKFAGKSIVQRLVEDIVSVCDEKVDEIAFIIGDFGSEVEEELVLIANNLGAKGSIFFQDKPLGTAHAILCAKSCLKGNVVVAFADTLFKADFKIDKSHDGIIWVSQIEDPSAFGVVKMENNIITDFVEKPVEFVSDLAIIGIYYFNSGENLSSELQFLIDKNIKYKGEYQLTSALENMKNKGLKFSVGKVNEWLDCGNKDATIYTNSRVLELNKNNNNLISKKAKLVNCNIISPCYIDDGVEIINSTIGPYVSIGKNTLVKNSAIKNSIIQEFSRVFNTKTQNSMIGNYVSYEGKDCDVELSLGDFCEQK